MTLSVTVSKAAGVKVVAHAMSNVTCAVQGALIGKVDASDASNLIIYDVAPLSHGNPTPVLIEGGMNMAEEAFCKDGKSVVGWYTANERLDDSVPGEGEKRGGAAGSAG